VTFCLRGYKGKGCEYYHKKGYYNFCSNKNKRRERGGCDYARTVIRCSSNKAVGCKDSYQFDDRGNASTRNISKFGSFEGSLWFCVGSYWCNFGNRKYFDPVESKKPARLISL